MTHLEIFNKLMEKAKANGYTGPDYSLEVGRILDGTNYYALIFREDFAKAVWGEEISVWDISGKEVVRWKHAIRLMVDAQNKWKFLEENAL